MPQARTALGRRRVAAIGAIVIGLALLAALALGRPAADVAPSPTASVVVGVPGGGVVLEATDTPTATPDPTPTATPDPTPSASPPPAPTSPPDTPAPNPVPSAAPSAVVVVAVARPDDAVAAFYGNVVDGSFDAAYSLWSDRMKATYPRQENLDDRFASTASIAFDQLAVVSETGATATVQANFTETYDSGGSRRFIGYWNLVRVEGRWLLDEPHY